MIDLRQTAPRPSEYISTVTFAALHNLSARLDSEISESKRPDTCYIDHKTDPAYSVNRMQIGDGTLVMAPRW